MSTDTQANPVAADARHGAGPVVSTRYNEQMVAWATRKLECSKSELVKRGLDRVMEDLGWCEDCATKEAA